MADTAGNKLKNINVVYGITGGIAAYKSPLVVRGLIEKGLSVDCILTDSAKEFVTPLTLATLTSKPVYSQMFINDLQKGYEINHISLAEKASLFLIAPATANFLAKMAYGLADDLLSSTVLATRAPVLVCPAMNTGMLENKATLENLKILKSRGINILEPASGFLACGTRGKGRMPDPERIVAEAIKLLTKNDLEGKKIVITCGPTCEDIDPVRYLTNRSSGKMGAAIAEAACLRGANVTVISGPVSLTYAPWTKVINVRSAKEMLLAVKDNLFKADVLIMAAAVADYTPKSFKTSKIKKDGKSIPKIELTSTTDILSAIKAVKGKKLFIGFAAETDDLMKNAKSKLERKGLDYIVANKVGESGTGFASDTNTGFILSLKGISERFELMEKTELAWKILDLIRKRS